MRVRTFVFVGCAIVAGCTYRSDPEATRIEKSKQVTAKDDAATELVAASTTTKPRPLPKCLASIEGLSAPALSERADQLAERHDAERPEAGAPPTAAQLEASCAFAWDDFALRLQNAAFEHRDLLEREDGEPPSATAWADVDRRWNALASRGAELLDECRRSVPGSPAIAQGLVWLAYANVAAERSGMAEAVMKRLIRFHPEHAERVAACFEEAQVAAWRKAVPADVPNLMRTSPEPTGIAACDRERRAELCQLRGELPKRQKEALAVVGPPPEALVDSKKCQARFERARAKLAGTSWCYLDDYAEPAPQPEAPSKANADTDTDTEKP